MKKSITGVVALLAGAFVAHSQGTVSFGNYLALSPYIYVSLGSTKLGGSAANTGVAANDTGSGADWTVALWGASGSGDTAAAVAANGNLATATLETGTGDATPGTWLSTTAAVIPGTTLAGQAVTLQVAAWYNDGGTLTSYAAAQGAGMPVGLSALANGTTGGPNTSGPPSTAPALPTGLGNISLSSSVIPEPSTIALGVMGASAFLLRLRKKQ